MGFSQINVYEERAHHDRPAERIDGRPSDLPKCIHLPRHEPVEPRAGDGPVDEEEEHERGGVGEPAGGRERVGWVEGGGGVDKWEEGFASEDQGHDGEDLSREVK